MTFNFFNRTFFRGVDWILLAAIVPVALGGLGAMYSFTKAADSGFFGKQLIWLSIGILICFGITQIDARFWKNTRVLVILFSISTFLLFALFALGKISHGARSWFSVGSVSFEPVDLAKLVTILILAKYFSRRHVEIRRVRHIFISLFYMLIPFILVFLQPDFGSAMIIFFIWFGMVLVSGISKRHLAIVFLIGIAVFSGLWFFVFKPYQKARIVNFVNPLHDIRGTGYNAYQSTIAVGSGQFFGKGLGFGTQSRLAFLPEYQTDFIFAAFAEEWGFVGVLILLFCYGVIVYRIIQTAQRGAGNFEILFCLGFAILVMSHIFVNIGMNIGILPVTGITLPFMSYGGSNLFILFAGLGILFAIRRNSSAVHKEDIHKEFLGI